MKSVKDRLFERSHVTVKTKTPKWIVNGFLLRVISLVTRRSLT